MNLRIYKISSVVYLTALFGRNLFHTHPGVVRAKSFTYFDLIHIPMYLILSLLIYKGFPKFRRIYTILLLAFLAFLDEWVQAHFFKLASFESLDFVLNVVGIATASLLLTLLRYFRY